MNLRIYYVLLFVYGVFAVWLTLALAPAHADIPSCTSEGALPYSQTAGQTYSCMVPDTHIVCDNDNRNGTHLQRCH